jgi:DNA-binding transcriptional regulator YbjK
MEFELMPPNPERRALIADVAIEILAEVGAGGLTHRVVDTRANLPSGTTSNFFRTRLALLQGAAQRLAELHWQYVTEQRALIGRPNDRAAVAALLGRLLQSSDEQARVRNLARFELFLEGNRRPELRPILEDIYAAAMQQAAVVLSSAGVPTPPARVRLLARLLGGLLFDQLTLPDAAMAADEVTDTVNQLLDLVLDAGPIGAAPTTITGAS